VIYTSHAISPLCQYGRTPRSCIPPNPQGKVVNEQDRARTSLWYNSIGSAEVVRSYWVERINDSQASERCGFVYETGLPQFRMRNHIHIPSDFRPINSPEYARWFWIELISCD